MPVVNRSNNRILPANARAVDVARRTIHQIADVQQRKHHGTLSVQGYYCLVYTRLESGQPCSCGALNKSLSQRLNEDGKLEQGKINQLITGGYEFRVAPYAARRRQNPDWVESGETEQADTGREGSIWDNGHGEEGNPPPFERIARDDADDPSAKTIEPQGDAFGANGPVLSADRAAELEDDVFDPDSFQLNDVSCPVCLGTSYIGGVNLLGGWRKVIVPQDTSLETDGDIVTTNRPLSVQLSKALRYPLVLPFGARVLDVLRVLNGTKIVPSTVLIDSVPITNERGILNFCDGKPHTLDVVFAEHEEWTHVEIQLGLSGEPVPVEFPRLGNNSDQTKLDSIDEVSLNISPLVPYIKPTDFLVESTFGRVLQIVSVNSFNDDQRRLHGWDVQARIVQPQELFHMLPRRSVLKQKATVPVRDNGSGVRRT